MTQRLYEIGPFRPVQVGIDRYLTLDGASSNLEQIYTELHAPKPDITAGDSGGSMPHGDKSSADAAKAKEGETRIEDEWEMVQKEQASESMWQVVVVDGATAEVKT